MPGWCWCRAAAVSPRLPTSPTTIGPCCGTKWTSPAARCARSRLATSSTWARWAISCANCMCTSSRVAKAMTHGPGRSGVTARRSPMASLPCTNAWPRCAMHWRCRRSVETAHIQFERLAEDALLLRFGERIDATINARVQVAVDVLQHRLPSLECVPAYASVLLRFDPLAWRDADSADPHQALERVVRAALDAGEAPPRPPRDQEIPVCYGGVHGPDLAEVAQRLDLPIEDIVVRHVAADYRVAMIGFAPGFPYLLGLDPALTMRQRADRRGADRHLSGRAARRLATDRAHAAASVRCRQDASVAAGCR